MAKPDNLPRWADQNPGGVVEPNEAKKNTGWVVDERPPAQFFNWLLLKAYQWLQYLGRRSDSQRPMQLRAEDSVTWTGAELQFAENIDLYFREGGSVFRNSISNADSPLAIGDGQVLVLRKDNTQDTNLSVQAVYGDLSDGEYIVVDEASLTDTNEEQEIILFRRRGDELELPFWGRIINAGQTLFFGELPQHDHSGPEEGGQFQHNNLLGRDNLNTHSVFTAVDGSRAFTGNQSMGGNRITNAQDPVGQQDYATKEYVDNNIPGLHTHEIPDVGSDQITVIWNADGGGLFDGNDDDSGIAFPLATNGTANGEFEFDNPRADGAFMVLPDPGATIDIMDDNSGSTLYTIENIVNLGGGRYRVELQGDPDITRFTTGQNARFWMKVIQFMTGTGQSVFNGENDWQGGHRLQIWYELSEDLVFTVEVDGVADNDIVIPSIIGYHHYGEGFDANDGYSIETIERIGDNWRFTILLRNRDDARLDLYFNIIPRESTASI